MRKAYPSDISREQYEMIKEEIESCRKKTRPREVDLYEILCGVLYIVKEGVTWRALPHDYPDYNLVYYYFSIWSKKEEFGTSVLDGVLSELVKLERLSNDREATATMLIVDSKSIQNADTAGEKGYDGGKKTGVKLHLGVDIIGMPHAITVTAADVTDRDGAIEMVDLFRSRLPSILKLLCDGGYTGEPFSSAVNELIGAAVEIAKRNELHTFVVIPKRWVVERTFGWLDKYRRFWKNCERYTDNLVQLVVTILSNLSF